MGWKESRQFGSTAYCCVITAHTQHLDLFLRTQESTAFFEEWIPPSKLGGQRRDVESSQTSASGPGQDRFVMSSTSSGCY